MSFLASMIPDNHRSLRDQQTQLRPDEPIAWTVPDGEQVQVETPAPSTSPGPSCSYGESMTSKQAIIVIHGIGEQVPMDTLRSVVDGLGFQNYRSRPDRLSGDTELRRLVVPPQKKARPRTDFYELYWAHHMHQGRIRGTFFWAFKLFFRLCSWWGTPIRPAMLTLAALLSLLTAGSIVWVLSRGFDELLDRSVTIGVLVFLMLLLLIGNFLGYQISHTIADASRYLTPRPANIAARTVIRRQGVDLLRRLHESGEYQRIVVIGHSLGSVIGYDILRSYWDEARHADPSKWVNGQSKLKEWAELVGSLPQKPKASEIDKFQIAQHRLWREQRALGVPWLVTDFITLGSPLTHARMLLTTHRTDLVTLKRDRELPTCPPTGDNGEKYPGFYANTFELPQLDGQKRTIYVADTGALFSCTRWTNLYFPVHKWFCGDLVGGPIGQVLGTGVRDIAVRRTAKSLYHRFCAAFFPLPHSRYWKKSYEKPLGQNDRRAKNRRTGTHESILIFRHVIDLQTERAAEPYPPPDPKR